MTVWVVFKWDGDPFHETWLLESIHLTEDGARERVAKEEDQSMWTCEPHEVEP